MTMSAIAILTMFMMMSTVVTLTVLMMVSAITFPMVMVMLLFAIKVYKILCSCLNNFIVRKPLKYFDFLNASTQFDVLIVSDVTTRGVWPFNPYLPSKLSDYLGSKTDIWALCEKGSTLSSFDLKYKSNIADFNDSID